MKIIKEAAGGEGAVKTHAAPAHDHNAPAHAGASPQRGLAQKLHSLYRRFRAGNGQGIFLRRAGGHDNRVMGGAQFRKRHIPAHHGVYAGAHACFQHPAHFPVHHIAGQAEIRHTVAGHAAQHGIGFIHGNVMTEQGQKIG